MAAQAKTDDDATQAAAAVQSRARQHLKVVAAAEPMVARRTGTDGEPLAEQSPPAEVGVASVVEDTAPPAPAPARFPARQRPRRPQPRLRALPGRRLRPRHPVQGARPVQPRASVPCASSGQQSRQPPSARRTRGKGALSGWWGGSSFSRWRWWPGQHRVSACFLCDSGSCAVTCLTVCGNTGSRGWWDRAPRG